jgi:undecaprenyl-phosphate 4-deoxy-4-formamido-L-arabinose transferase
VDRNGGPFVHGIAVVVPVYQGERTLDRLVDELSGLTELTPSPRGRLLRVVEVVLVYDNGPDRSDEVIRRLAEAFPFVRPVWLSRNYGQHAATLAGMASTSADWIVTLDEDGQHNPADIPRLLDTALDQHVPLVYADATNPAPHNAVRNAGSALARWVATSVMTSHELGRYSSYRLIIGELGRAVAAYGGQDIYLDVALSWVAPSSATTAVEVRHNSERRSGYRLRTLFSYFWRLVLTSGTRPLRAVAVAGVLAAVLGFLLSLYLIYARIVHDIKVDGWTSVTVTTLMLSGAVLFAVGVISEYVGVAVRMALGRPPYLIVRDPRDGPLAQTQAVSSPDAERIEAGADVLTADGERVRADTESPAADATG